MAIKKAPSNRAPGPDGIVSELFKIFQKISAQLITEIWKTVGRLKYSPKLLNLIMNHVPNLQKRRCDETGKLQANRINLAC